MKKHLIVTVHGLGEQVAGATVDALVGAARKELDCNVPVHHNTVLVPEEVEETADPSNPSETSLYECHIRRMRRSDDEELVFAEVHWSDLSAAPKGAFATALDLLRLVLGLGYLALDNVQNSGVKHRPIVHNLVRLFVWMFFAVIAPLNGFLFLGALSMLIDPFAFKFADYHWLPETVLGLYALAVFTIAGRFAKSAETYLLKTFLKSLRIMGLLTMIIAVVAILPLDLNALGQMVPSCGADQNAARPELQGINCFTGAAVLLLNLAWLFEVALLWLLVIASAGGAFRDDLYNKRSIYLAICAGMLLFWMIFSVAIWAVFQQTVQGISSPDRVIPLETILDTQFADATTTLVYGVFSLTVLLLVAGLVTFLRNKAKPHLAQGDGPPSSADLKLGRLILNPFLNIVLFASIFILTFGVFYTFAEAVWMSTKGTEITCGELETWVFRVACNIDGIADRGGPAALAAVGLLGVFIFRYSTFFASVLGIARDVIVYVTRSNAENPGLEPEKSQYIFRARIECRFTNTLRHLLAMEGPEASQVTVVSHSQGTVVSLRGLEQISDELPPTVNLITMGSPLTHVYAHYFRREYMLSRHAVERLSKWFNIYRGDDFVGTRIDSKLNSIRRKVQNRRVAPKGHTGYWTDPNVWKVLRDEGIFDPIEMAKPAAPSGQDAGGGPVATS